MVDPQRRHPGETPLRDDVRLLGELLGDVLREHAGQALFELVEKVRASAKRARLGHGEDATALQEALAAIPTVMALPLARAFAHFLALANVAEQHHRARSGASAERPLARVIRDAMQAGASAADVAHAVASQRIELVLTAHPTQVVRRTVRLEHRAIDEALTLRDRSSGPAREEIRLEIARHIAVLWHTDDVRRRKPTAADEVRAGLALFEQVIWEAVPRHLRALDAVLARTTGARLPDAACPVRFGTWVGGDRDGNPHVTALVTHEATLRARWSAARLWRGTLERLRDELSVVVATPELRERAPGEREPYRALLSALIERVDRSERWCEQAVIHLNRGEAPPAVPGDLLLDAAELEGILDACDASLRACGLAIVAEGPLLDARRKARCFGLVLAPLDVRQEASVHAGVLDSITRALGQGSYLAWSESERMEFIRRELASPRSLLPREPLQEPQARELLDTLAVIRGAGPGSFGAYVISMASAPSDVLAVILLQREARIEPALRVVPLFETLADLQRAPGVLATLLDEPAFLANAGARVEIMVGYSDSAKDAGRLGSAWAIHRAIEEISSVANTRAVDPVFFHGRGGTVGRGGGPIRDSILSLPPRTTNGRLRVTVQGESIDSTLGLEDSAMESLELYVASVLEASLCPAPPAPAPFREEMDRLAQEATLAYRSMVHQEPRFVPYFRAVTPERELGLIHAGSRPARRKASDDVASLRAIPWVFAWNQVRLMLPAWLGVGEALQAALADAERTARIETMASAWPFFRSIASLVAMSLAKGDPSVVRLYERQLVSADLQSIGDDLRSRFEAARSSLVQVLGHSELLENEPILRESILLRNPYIDPLNILQAELLRRVRAGDEDPTLIEALLVTVNGIAAGLRNTG